MCRSGCGFESDPVAQRCQLADVVADLALGTGVAWVELRAQVVEAGIGIGQQMPDDDQQRPADRDDGLLRAAASSDPPVALTEEGLGVTGRDRSLAQHPGQVGIAVPGTGGFLASSGLADT